MTFARRMPSMRAARSWQWRVVFAGHDQVGRHILIHRSASWTTSYAASRNSGAVTMESLPFLFLTMSVLEF